ncbi:MAG: DUF547 domain-containing protein [Oceanococcus sp.]
MKPLQILFLSLISFAATAAPKAELWSFWADSQESSAVSVDHGDWTTFLSRYMDTSSQPFRLAYAAVSQADQTLLDGYLKTLQITDPRALNRAEQQAYWINLYNAATIDLILNHYPVKSITKIKSGFFSFGPWDKVVLKVAEQELTLNDIEHRILRPIFKDPRLHYAVNCASIGCPNLAAQAYTAQNTERLLETGAQAYINDPRGVSIENSKLIVSSIYDWFQIDFGGTDARVLQHLRQYANAELKAALNRLDTINSYQYDWSLNDRR